MQLVAIVEPSNGDAFSLNPQILHVFVGPQIAIVHGIELVHSGFADELTVILHRCIRKRQVHQESN